MFSFGIVKKKNQVCAFLNLLPLKCKLILFDFSVKMDLGQLNIFPLSTGTEDFLVESTRETLQEERDFASWFQLLIPQAPTTHTASPAWLLQCAVLRTASCQQCSLAGPSAAVQVCVSSETSPHEQALEGNFAACSSSTAS